MIELLINLILIVLMITNIVSMHLKKKHDEELIKVVKEKTETNKKLINILSQFNYDVEEEIKEGK